MKFAFEMVRTQNQQRGEEKRGEEKRREEKRREEKRREEKRREEKRREQHMPRHISLEIVQTWKIAQVCLERASCRNTVPSILL